MGGGDLNTKKSWHPSTLKNQERVWKAEQAVAEENKRILELQREREQENDRAQLNELAQQNFGAGGSNQPGDNRLHWMYDKPDKQVQHEDYLLGKEIGKNESDPPQHAIPVVSRRVVGSSMTKTLDDTQVDLVRKLREDPLLLVKERERAARAALLSNPLQRKRLADLLRLEKDQKESTGESKKKKKSKKNLDGMLAAKLSALGGNKGIDLSNLLNSNDSSSESSSDEISKKKKKKKTKKSKKTKKNKKKYSDTKTSSEDDTKKLGLSPDSSPPNYQSYYNRTSESTNYDRRNVSYDSDHKSTRKRETDEDNYRKKRERSYDNSKHQSSSNQKDKHKSLDKTESRKRESSSYNERDGKAEQKRSKRDNSHMSRNDSDTRYKQCSSSDVTDRSAQKFVSGKKFEGRERRPGMSETEKAAKLAEMAAAGKEREVERGDRVAKQRAVDAAAAAEASRRPARSLHNEARTLPDSLESRIRSNKHYIQRDKMHMNQNFAKR